METVDQINALVNFVADVVENSECRQVLVGVDVRHVPPAVFDQLDGELLRAGTFPAKALYRKNGCYVHVFAEPHPVAGARPIEKAVA